MRKFKDDRNRAYNDVFPEIGKGDINVSILYPGTIKAFHRHQKQDDYWFVVKGNIRAVLAWEEEIVEQFKSAPMDTHPGWHSCQGRTSNSPFYVRQNAFIPKTSVHYLSEGDILHIPAGKWHGLQVLGDESAIMLYHITTKYSETDPDEERAPWDKFFSWQISRK